MPINALPTPEMGMLCFVSTLVEIPPDSGSLLVYISMEHFLYHCCRNVHLYLPAVIINCCLSLEGIDNLRRQCQTATAGRIHGTVYRPVGIDLKIHVARICLRIKLCKHFHTAVAVYIGVVQGFHSTDRAFPGHKMHLKHLGKSCEGYHSPGFITTPIPREILYTKGLSFHGLSSPYELCKPPANSSGSSSNKFHRSRGPPRSGRSGGHNRSAAHSCLHRSTSSSPLH